MKTSISLGILFLLVLIGGYVLPDSYGTSRTYPSTTTVTATTTATTVASGGAVVYTSAQVSSHASSADCWSSINGNVYNLTSWISQHPGGEGAILSICGKDGSAAFNAQHGNDGRVDRTLATFKIGSLSS